MVIDEIKVANQLTVQWEVILDYLGEPTVITRVFPEEAQECQVREGEAMKAKVRVTGP